MEDSSSPCYLRAALLVLITLVLPHCGAQTPVFCSRDNDCKELFPRRSECLKGVCTNPFYHNGGCLRTYIKDYPRIRTCSSEDPPEAEKLGFCQRSQFNYMETRLLSQNWQSSHFSTWLFQIVLSEMMGVPVSIENGDPNASLDLYNREADYDFLAEPSLGEISIGSKVGDCRLLGHEQGEHTSCAHMILESWKAEDSSVSMDVERERDLGALGTTHWFVPKFVAVNDTSLLFYEGLAGEENRRKLANTFKRPTNWKQYCEEVSPDNCLVDDGTSSRAPRNQMEEESMFVEGLYTGHFRATEENDCEKHPRTCTGHIVDYPCYWLTHTIQQTHHLQIALESNGSHANGGYSYTQMNQIWAAANATRSPVIMLHWTPDGLYQKYLKTEAEFTSVALPPPTQTCVDSRAHVVRNCGDNYEHNVGGPEGACDWHDQPMKKLVAHSFRELTQEGDEAMWSPAYGAFLNFEITSLHYADIFRYLFDLQRKNRGGFDPRDAVCQWAVDHMDILESFIPTTYPRILQADTPSSGFWFSSGLIVAWGACLLTTLTSLGVYFQRNTKQIYFEQVQTLGVILLGLLLVGLAALFLVLPPTGFTCILSVWLTDIGYTLQIIPLLVKVNVINSGSRRRERLRLRTMTITTAVALCFVLAFLCFWTILDGPERQYQYDLTSGTSGRGDTIVISSQYCGSDSDIWMYFSFSWQAILLFGGMVIAFLTSLRKVGLHDTNIIGLTLSSHFVFVLMRGFVFALGTENRADTMQRMSQLLSWDMIVSLAIYFGSNLKRRDEEVAEILPDLFLNTTIMMSDIKGFTAWSSVREPVHVFKFLDLVYESFDNVAERHDIFKVETTGERYVAAGGIPEFRPNHAIVVAQFASDIMKKMEALLRKLEVHYGPDTCDLSLQIALHSGPVTGGCLKGRHSRFQLFGDTMTTAGLIHSTGESNRIHVSPQTASLLIDEGKKRWLQERHGKIQTIEKGGMQTYWLVRYCPRISSTDAIEKSTTQSIASSLPVDDEDEGFELGSEERWVEWNMEVLRPLVQRIVARRQHRLHTQRRISRLERRSEEERTSIQIDMGGPGDMPLDEVKEIIELPAFDKGAAKRQSEHQSRVAVSEEVTDQLRDYISHVAGMYRQNPFHNFAHASYVVMAVTKYMNRIIAASEIDVGFDEDHHLSSTHAAIHDHTYGITSDPLTQFACVFSALIHDIDHPGVPNGQLIRENTRLAQIYKNRSVAEQNSFDLAWDLFLDPRYDELRTTVCRTAAELRRFRSLVINSVMATDLGDQELKALRNGRWSKAFDKRAETDTEPQVAVNRKATIVIEHLIQAADVAHTCQHWHIYRKWNQRLFEECYLAYKAGRAEKNPAEYWYKGEIGFFDFYIIPLSKKLRDCGVFGSTSDENLTFAEENKAMWLKEGEAIVSEMLETIEETQLEYTVVE